MSLPYSVLLSFLLSLVIVALALWRGWLSRSGATAAVVVGVLTMGVGGWLWGVLLGVFFVSSSVLSKFKEREKVVVSAEKFDKGNTRDAWQVLANGGIGSLIALLSLITPSPLWFAAFLGVMATVTADTWATELGTLSRTPPRLITTGRIVEAGRSGAISPFGTLATALGALLIGAVAAIWQGAPALLLIAGVGGLIGSLTDSLLGATVQRIFWDESIGSETEKRVVEERELEVLRGWSWMTNDVVNVLASVAGGCVAALLGFYFM